MTEQIPSAEEILAWAKDFARQQALEPRQSELLQVALTGFGSQFVEADPQPCFYLPPLVSAAVNPNDLNALPVAAVATMIYLGVDIFDDVADGDLPGHWRGYNPAEINLVAATFFSALPALALGCLALAPAQIAAAQQIISEGLLGMAAGQHGDVQMRGASAPDPTQVEASLAGKTGAELAMFARLAATAAGAPNDTIEAYGEMGRAFGIAGQLSSDCYDLFQADWSKDLANGTRTFPLASHLARLRGREHDAFLALLGRARRDAQSQRQVREQLRAAGVLRRCAVYIEVDCQRAHRHLVRASPQEPAASALRRRIGRASLFGGAKN